MKVLLWLRALIECNFNSNNWNDNQWHPLSVVVQRIGLIGNYEVGTRLEVESVNRTTGLITFKYYVC